MQIKQRKDWNITFLLGPLLAFSSWVHKLGLIEWSGFSPSRHLLFVWWHEWRGCYPQPQCYQPLPSPQALETKFLLWTGPAGQCTGCLGWQGCKQEGDTGGFYEAGCGKMLLPLMYLIKWALGAWFCHVEKLCFLSPWRYLQIMSTGYLKMWHWSSIGRWGLERVLSYPHCVHSWWQIEGQFPQRHFRGKIRGIRTEPGHFSFWEDEEEKPL